MITYSEFNPKSAELTKYLFFTGKGGVGKTSVACATAVYLADNGKKVFLISTDPASNLQDVFNTELDNKGKAIPDVPNLVVANLNPEEAAAEYRESVVGPYRGVLPQSAIESMEEQLSGSCTVEIASFNEFAHFITDTEVDNSYDYIIFDTAPTGHTLRMLELPSAWDSFIDESTHGASCLGQLAGLGEKKEMYARAVATLSDPAKTTLVLVARPEVTPLEEAARAAKELLDIGIGNQRLILNGFFSQPWDDDPLASAFYNNQQKALANIPETLKALPIQAVPLRSYNISGLANIRRVFKEDDHLVGVATAVNETAYPGLTALISDLYKSKKKVIFTMGKGGVGKTTIASAIALGLAKLGAKVHLTTTDPAGHISASRLSNRNVEVSNIDEEEELQKYKDEVLGKARANNMSQEDIDYIEEDLRSPCTQEIAIFRAFADIVEKAEEQVVVIDTAPTGHTLLLLNSTESYHKEMKRSNAEIPESVRKLLPRLKNHDETEVIIVTLPEATPFYEADRLEKDLKRADIDSRWWVINSSLSAATTADPLMRSRAVNESPWISRISEHTNGRYAVVPWQR